MNEAITVDEIQRLPLRAIVALCSRCATRRRVEFDLPGNTQNRGRVMAAVDAAIHMARNFAAGLPVPSNAPDIIKAALDAAGEAPPNMFGVPATKAGFAAIVVRTIYAGQLELVPNRAEMCIRAAGKAAVAARADYERLRELNLGTFPELGKSVDVSESGPLGPLWGLDAA